MKTDRKSLSGLLCAIVALTLAGCGGGQETVANDPPPPPPVDTTAPSVPNNLSATRSNNTTVVLTWAAATDTGGSGLAGYHVFRNGTQVTVTVVTATSYTDTGAGAAANSYQVRALDNALNQSVLSTAVNAPAAADTTPPSVPSGLAAAAAGANQVNLTWTASTDTGGSGLAGYQVFRNGVNVTAAAVTGTTYSDSGLSPNTAYQYSVRAIDNAANASANSTIVTVTTAADSTAPSIPAGVTATANSSTQITISWSAATDTGGSGLAGYLVFRGGTQITPSIVTNLNFTDIGLAANTPYSYTVRAVDGASNQSANSAPASATTQPDITPPSNPSGLSGTAVSETQINLTWNSATDTGGSGFAGYRVYRNGALVSGVISNPSFADSGLTVNTSYTYFVRSVDNAGNESGNSNQVVVSTLSDTTAPSTPSGLTATAASSSTINLSWSASTDTGGSGLRGYLVFRGATQLTPSPIAATTYSDTGLTASTAYSYTVRAVDNAGNQSPNSAAANATTLADTTAPTVPANLVATAFNSTQIDLSWSASTDNSGGSGLAGYRIYRNGSFLLAVGASTLAYSDTGLAPNTAYSYTVSAIDNANNESAQSTATSATTPAGTAAPSTPASLTGNAPSANQVNLNWSASTDNSGTGLAGYRVFRNGVLITPSPISSTNFADSGLLPNTTYSYFVRAIDNANNQSANSNTIDVQTQPDTTAPTIPASVSATANSSTQITVTWSASTDIGGSGVNGYRVFRSGTLIGTTSAATLTWVDSPLAANTSYNYTVRAFDVANNESADSAPSSAQTLPDTTAPSIPAGLTATATGSQQISVTWNASTDTGGSGLRGYLVFRGATPLTASPITSTSYSDTGLSPNTAYSYSVRAVDNANNESANAGPVSTNTLADTTPPPAPSGLTATATSSTAVSLAWNGVTDLGGGTLAGYLIFRGGTQLTPSPITATTYADSGLTPNTNYNYTVRAVDNFTNTSGNSNTATVTTPPDTTKPSSPGSLGATSTLTPSIQLSWTASTDTGGSGLALYVIYRNGSQLTTSLGTSFTDSTVAFNVSYAYSVTARDNAGNESDPSNTVNASAQDNTAPNAPTGLSASATGSTSIALSWTAATDPGGSGIAGYRVYRGGSLLNPSNLITTTSYTDTGLTANTSYSYVVRSVDRASNQSGDSNTVSATTNSAATGGLDFRPSNTSCLAPNEPTSSSSYALQRQYLNRSFSAVIYALQEPGNGSRWYIVEQDGQIRWFNASDSNGSNSNLLADLSDRVEYSAGLEFGLLGMAFHPNFANNRWVFVTYNAKPTLELRVSRFIMLPNDTLDTASEAILLRVPKPFSNHNGGGIQFGPDGYLYFGIGDGGSGGDPNGNSQNKRTLLGKMVRIDVSPGTSYTIPPSNPYAGNPLCVNNPGPNGVGANNCPEIYALGLRNPWRWSFDRGSSTPTLWAGDVGQNRREEIDVIQLGGNYGWNCREGTLSFLGCSPAIGDPGFIEPVIDYDHSLGIGSSVTGGYVYRGSQLPGLVGQYLFADFSGLTVHRLQENVDGTFTRVTLLTAFGDGASSFAEGADGELYLVGYSNGGLHKIMANSSSQNNTVPSDLAATGCFQSGNTQLPASGLIPYAPNAPFWSDNAVKERWLAIPDNTTITVNGDGDWTFPTRTVLVKNFRLNGRIFETRLFMRHADTGNWRGYTYRWNDTQTAATLVNGGLTVNVEGQPWTYPSGTQCLQCHTAAAGNSLGLETAQLNGNLTYPQTGRTANQLATLNAIGMIALPDPSTLPSYSDPYGSAALAGRARAYLHTNCAQCHRPSGGTGSNMDLRHDTGIASSNTCDVSPTRGDLGIANARLIAPGDPSRSIVLQRMNRRGTNQMPPIGSHLVDAPGAAVLSSWISSMNASCN